MKHKGRVAALSASVLIVLTGGHALRAHSAQSESQGTAPLPLIEASVTAPDSAGAVVAPGSGTPAARGWSQAAAAHSTQDLRPELVNAYTRAVAVAPAACHLSVSLLAAIGQVESGNLAGHTIDAANRVVPEILGPVLDGRRYARIPDTDNGRWDGNTSWDRALGPMQFVPASWRVVGLDLDDDGTRDPQNIFDAAGAAMVYLCADSRDLSTEADLKEAVLAYNHSVRYLHLVLGWKTVFDAADITGLQSQPALGAWAMPALPDETRVANAAGDSTGTAAAPRGHAATGTGGSSGPTGGPSATTSGAAGPTSAASPTQGASSSAEPDPGPSGAPDPSTDAPDPSTGPTTAPTVPADPASTCLPSPTASGEPSVVPSIVPTVVPSGTPGDGTLPDPCATLLPGVPASASPSAD